MCLSFVPPFITTCIANEDKRDDKRRSNLPFFHTFPTQHVYFSAITKVNACYERRQYSLSSISESAAVSSTTANLASAGHSSVSLLSPGTGDPPSLACLRQLYRVTSLMFSCRANSATDILMGGSSFLSKAALRSLE